jgi:hypothetical protein
VKFVLGALLGAAVVTAAVALVFVGLDKWKSAQPGILTGEVAPSDDICGKGHYGELRHLPDGTVQVCRQ